MKLVVNAGVRKTMQDLAQLMDQLDALSLILADRGSLESTAMEAGLDKRSCEAAIHGAACRLISHATQGKRYPMMTAGSYRINSGY